MRRSYLTAATVAGAAATLLLAVQMWPSYDRLWHAISSGSTLVVKAALLTGSDPNGCDYPSAQMYMGAPDPPLVHAVSTRNPKVVEVLLSAGANPNVTFGDGGTPLELALHSDEPRSVRVLLEYGADPLAAAGDKTLVAWAMDARRAEDARLMQGPLELRDPAWRTRSPRQYAVFCSK